jgi:DNA-binding response OmpR family regulator
LDSSTYTVSKGEEEIELSKKEFELLYKFLSYPGVIFTKAQLMDEIWGYDSDSDDTTIKTHINRLRNKFEGYQEFEIVTIRGLGYKAEVREK